MEIEVDGDRLIIRAAPRLRLGWDEVFAAMAERHDDVLLNHINTTDWDRFRANHLKLTKINGQKSSFVHWTQK